MRLVVLASMVVIATLACSDPEPPRPPPRGEPTGPPPVPTVDQLPPASEGRSQVARPEWNADEVRFEHPVRDLRAKFGAHESVRQILLGDDSATGVLLNYYGDALDSGDYRVLAATDETRAEHAGRDSRVFTLTVGEDQGALRSMAGAVTIEAATDDRITGTLDVRVQSRNMMRETEVRARFHAVPDALLTAELEHQAAIREQMRNR
jgi:hypothetical protein